MNRVSTFFLLCFVFSGIVSAAQQSLSPERILSSCVFYNTKLDTVHPGFDDIRYIGIINSHNCIDCVKSFPEDIVSKYPDAAERQPRYIFASQSEYFSPAIDRRFLHDNNPAYDTLDLYFLDLHSACIQSTSAGLGTLLREKSPFLLIRTDTGWQVDNSFIYIKK